ncbi:Kinesin-4 [Platanthera guangdongensis]|uniref:Kinesin-4 n=1 Tax=Platanthera guangdongensis TaxID=2320717 RepID=A0ABR2N193_9ASPA
MQGRFAAGKSARKGVAVGVKGYVEKKHLCRASDRCKARCGCVTLVVIKQSREGSRAHMTMLEERIKQEEQHVWKLTKEKESSSQMILELKQDLETTKDTYEHRCQKLKVEANQNEARLQERISEVEFLLSASTKRINELEVFSESKFQSVKLKGLIDAAENYHTVLAENRKLYNEVQELKGNIRVYCRVRPFLTGQNSKSTKVDHIGENGELVLVNPARQGKDSHRMFKFNKVLGPTATQVNGFLDIQPLIRSVLDGYNVCIFAYGQTGSEWTTLSSKEEWGVNYRALSDLFHISQPHGLAVPDASMFLVKSTSDVLELMQFGQTNRAVGSTALNERSSRSHSILTIHVQGVDLKSGSTSRGCLHLIDLAGSERVDRSKVTGYRLKEAQYIKSLSSLGDVIFALSQKSAHIPYRNSKLTQVLQTSLGGHAKTLMFVQVNPDVESYSETLSTLMFAERVSGVELGAAKSSKEGKDVKDLIEQVAALKCTVARKDDEIEQLRQLKDPSSVSEKLLLREDFGSVWEDLFSPVKRLRPHESDLNYDPIHAVVTA